MWSVGHRESTDTFSRACPSNLSGKRSRSGLGFQKHFAVATAWTLGFAFTSSMTAEDILMAFPNSVGHAGFLLTQQLEMTPQLSDKTEAAVTS